MRAKNYPRGWDTKTTIAIVAAQSGRRLSVRQLQGWDRKKVVVPELRGPRRTRLYGFQGIRRLCIVAGLLKAGVPSNRLGDAIRNIDRASTTMERSWDTLKIVTDGQSVFVVDGDSGIDAITGQVVSFILLGHLERTAQAACNKKTTKLRAAL